VLQGNTHYPHKLLSVFETHTEAIRKGKAAKPTEFGKLVKIQEAEGFITDYEVCATARAGWGPLGAELGAAPATVRSPTPAGGR